MEGQLNMAIRIQIRRDTAANWTSTNAALYPGEIGIETDTKKFKIGPVVGGGAVSTAWNSITSYANVVPSDLSNTLSDYIEVADLGNADGPAKLNVDGNLLIPEDSIIFEGSSEDAHETTLTVTNPTADRTITFPNATGTVGLQDSTDPLTNKTLTSPIVSGLSLSDASIVFEGATANDHETTLTVTDPTADRTITFPDATGTVALAENVAALSGATFTGNISIPSQITFEGTTANDFETIISVTDPTSDRVIVFPDLTGTVVTTGDTGSVTNLMLAGSIENNKLSNSAITINGTSTSLGGTRTLGTDDVSEGSTNKYFTDERAQDAIGNSISTGLSYNDTTGAISVDTTAIQAKVANVDDTEIGYLNGVTSGIQTQIDNKASLSGATFTGAVSGTSLTLSGDLTVNGTTTTLNSTTISVDDKNIELGSVATPSDATADGGGITLKGTTDKTFNWVDATDSWTSSEHVNLASGKSLYLNGTLLKDAAETLTNKTLTSPVISSITNTGTLTLPTTTGTVALTSDITVSASSTNTFSNKSISLASNVVTGTTAEFNAALSDSNFVTIGDSGTVTSTMIADGTIVNGDINASAAIAQSKIDGLSTSLSAKADLAGPTFTGTVVLPSTTSIGDVSSTELGYLNNVSSAIQTQLDGKVDESLFDTKGDILVASADNTPAKLAAGTNGYLLTANSSATNGVEWAAAPVSLPSQTGNSGYYLTTDGTSASWGALVVPITTGTATVSSNTATTIDTTALSAFTSIEYMVSLKQGSKVRTSKVVVQTDGTSVDMTEFAITETGGTIAGVVVSAAVASTNAVLQLTATDAATTNVTVKFSKVAL